MSENELTFLIIGSILFGFINAIRAAKYKALAEERLELRESNGWRSEALFLRHQINPEAAEFSEYN